MIESIKVKNAVYFAKVMFISKLLHYTLALYISHFIIKEQPSCMYPFSV